MSKKELIRAINDQHILKARVTKKVPRKYSTPEHLMVEVNFTLGTSATVTGILYMEDCDAETMPNHLDYLVGLNVPVVIKGIDKDGHLICSRKIAQQMLKKQMMPALLEKRIFDGVITGFTNFGAFVDVDGVVGILRNKDYSTDYSRVYERYQVGDHISVKCKAISSDDAQRIEWEPLVKYRRTTAFECDLTAGSVVLGRIIDIKNFEIGPAVFVRTLEHNEVDILCAMPLELEVQRNAVVVVRVSNVEPAANPTERPRIRGHILRLG